ncbi:Carnitine O-palmitoyltransferase 2, mitochondrial [Chamberlinius hualienensis]
MLSSAQQLVILRSIKSQKFQPCLWSLKQMSSNVSSDDFQYLPRSKVPMLHFQPSLPRLPVPELEKTCQRYLAAQKVLLTDEQYKTTEKIAGEFLQNDGKKLHKELLEFNNRNKHTSYITDMWFDMYLKSRDPLPLNFNPLIGFTDDPIKEYNDQLVRATNMLISSLKFMKSLRAKTLAPEVYHLNPAKSDTETFRNVIRFVPSRLSWYVAFLFKAFPLDMSQYGGLFNSTRIPQIGKDELKRQPDARHMLILRNGHMYVFDAIDSNGLIKEPKYLQACLAKVLSDQRPPAEFPIAALTTLERDSWTKLRQKLSAGGNGENLKLVDSALFAISFDDVSTNDDPFVAIPRMLHGDGRDIWFDKSFQLLMSRDGKAALNFEHSWGDGVAVLRYVNEIFKDSNEKHYVHPGSSPPAVTEDVVKPLTFHLDAELKTEIKNALENYEKITKNLGINCNIKNKFGKKFMKVKKLSPDSIMQLSFQIAYQKYKGKAAATYESCSTAAFLHGRTETIRSATWATKQCAEAFVKSPLPSSNQLREMMDACSKVHGQLTKEAATGQGFDRHLFALKVLAENAKLPTPAFYQDPAYKSINHNILSTSTLSSAASAFGGFGPVVKDGFGVAYRMDDNEMGTIITNYRSHTDGDHFSRCLLETWDQLHNILQH